MLAKAAGIEIAKSKKAKGIKCFNESLNGKEGSLFNANGELYLIIVTGDKKKLGVLMKPEDEIELIKDEVKEVKDASINKEVTKKT